jgi:hypothetical protein
MRGTWPKSAQYVPETRGKLLEVAVALCSVTVPDAFCLGSQQRAVGSSSTPTWWACMGHGTPTDQVKLLGLRPIIRYFFSFFCCFFAVNIFNFFNI